MGIIRKAQALQGICMLSYLQALNKVFYLGASEVIPDLPSMGSMQGAKARCVSVQFIFRQVDE